MRAIGPRLVFPLVALVACAPAHPPTAVDPAFSMHELGIIQATVDWFTRGDSARVPFVMLDRSDTAWATSAEILHDSAETRAWPFIPAFLAANATSRKFPCAALQPSRRPIVCVPASAFLRSPVPDWNAVQSIVPGTMELWSLSMPAVDSTGGHAWVVLNRYCAPGSVIDCVAFTLELCYSARCDNSNPANPRPIAWTAWRIQRLPADPDL